MASQNRYGLPDATLVEMCVQKMYATAQHIRAPSRRDYITLKQDLLYPVQPANPLTKFASPPQLSYAPGRRVTQVRQGNLVTISDRAFDAPRMRNR